MFSKRSFHLLYFITCLFLFASFVAAQKSELSELDLSFMPPSLGSYSNTSVGLGGSIEVLPMNAPGGIIYATATAPTDFKGLLTVNPLTGAVSLTNAHPAGNYAITVRGFDSSGQSVRQTFTLSVNVLSGCGATNFLTFTDPPPVDAGSSPQSVVFGDFNADGKQDLAVANGSSNNVSVLLGDGNGAFTNANYAVGTSPRAVVKADFNADGKPDIATANDSNNVSILINNGDGTFAARVNYGAGTFPRAIAVGDFNGDGKPDIVTGNTFNISILLNNGRGTFEAAANTSVAATPRSVAVGDFNADGKLDLAVVLSNGGTNNVSIFTGNGNGAFAAPTAISLGTSPTSVAVGDFNADGKQDLAAAIFGNSRVSILLGNGDGTFPAPTNFNVGTGPVWVAVGDFDADGKQDLVTANSGSHNISVLRGTGTGSFSLIAANYAAGSNPRAVAVGDYNGDDRQDLATANQNTNNVSIFRGNGLGGFGSSAPYYSAGTTPLAQEIGDFNNDGIQDIAAVNSPSNAVSVLLGNGNGSFGAAASYPVGGNPRSIVVGDFNGDGRQDLAASNQNSNNISILVGNGDGSFGTAVNYPSGINPQSIAAGDFNGDGKPDLTTANATYISVLFGLGDGTFGAAANFSALTPPTTVFVGEFNGDGKPDIITANGGSNTVAVFRNNGDGTFAYPPQNITVGTHPQMVALGDFNADGKQDFAVPNRSSNNVSILLGTGSGSFTEAVNSPISVGTFPLAVAIADFNGDGKADIVSANNTSNNLSVLIGAGDGTFAQPVNFATGTSPNSVKIGDFNADGKQDIATVNPATNNISILQRQCAINFLETALPNGQVGQNYNQSVNFSGGTSPFNVNVSGLPAGLNYTVTDRSITIAGAPTGSGSFIVTFSVSGTAPFAGTAENYKDLLQQSNQAFQVLPLQILAPTAAAVSVDGRVLSSNGQGVRTARVSLTRSDGTTRYTLTNAFGYYQFNEVATGETYIFSVSHKRETFLPQIVSVSEQIENLNFVAQP